MRSRMVQLLLSASSLLMATNASQLFVGGYGGTIITGNLGTDGVITAVATNGQSAPAPSWQEVSSNGNILYTIEEAHENNWQVGALTSYSIASNGELNKIQSAIGLGGPVSLTISPDQSVIFTASYDFSGVSAYSTDPTTGAVTHLEDWLYTLPGPGTVPSRQEKPHPHQALFDPTGAFVLAPDLGADVIRVFHVSGTNFTQLADIPTTAGSGPRHGVFVASETGEAKFYYLVHEINNSVTVFSVTYENDSIQLSPIQNVPTLPTPTSTATAAAGTPSAAELAFSPNKEHLYVSNRNDQVFAETHSVAAFKVDAESGELELIDYFDSGVVTARHISVDPSGKFFLAAGQDSSNVQVFARDEATGELSASPVSTFSAPGPVCVSWRV